MAEKDDSKRSRVVNRSGDDEEDDPRPAGPATLGSAPRTRRQLAEEVAEFRRNLRRRTEPKEP